MAAVILIVAASLLAFFVYASYSIQLGFYIKSICNIGCNEKCVAITFDDGPHPTCTPLVLDTLKRYGVEAAFFVIGKNIEGNEESLRRMESEGHLIGLHSYNHKATFPLLGSEGIVTEIEMCKDAVKRATCTSNPEYFRPPFGVTNPNIAAAIRKTGTLSVGWSIRSLDTTFNLADNKQRGRCIGKIVKRLSPGAIILLHDRLEYSHLLLEELIEAIHSKGYNIKRFDKI